MSFPVTPDPTPDPTPNPRPPRRRYLILLLKVGVGAGGILALLGLAAVIWGDRFVNAVVLPRLEDEIENTIDRPVELGEVERFYLWGVRLGTTTMPPTATDESTAVVDAVDVTADVRSLVFQRSLRPKITFVRPDVSLAQSEDGQWLQIGLPEPSGKEPLITLDIETIEVQDATLTASLYEQDAEVTVPREPLEATETDVLISFYGEESEQVDFELSGELSGEERAGEFDVEGKANLDERAVKANVRSQNLPTAGFNLLLPDSVGISSGTLNSNLKVEAALTEDDKLDESVLDLRGTVDLRAGEVKVDEVPETFSNIRSRLKFKGKRVTVEDTGLDFGEIALVAFGNADVDEGYDLTAQIPAVSIEQVQTLADLELPVAASGSFQFTTQVTGAIEDPQVKGRLANLQPLQVDRVGIETAVADFLLSSSQPLFEALSENPDEIPLLFDLTQLRLVTQEGGTVTASGEANLTDLQNPSFQLTAQADLDVDPVVGTFGISLPKDVVVGFLSADVEANGTLASPIASAEWQLSESTFPGRGELTFADNVAVLDNTRLRVADGTVTAEAVARLEEGTWQATAATDSVPIDQFTTQARGLLSADLFAAGRFDELDLEQIEARGSAAIANAEVYINDTRQSVIEPGTWRTAFEWEGDRIAVNSFTAPGVSANGIVGVDFDNDIPIGNFDLNVALRSFDLAPLNRFASPAAQETVEVAGLLNADVNLVNRSGRFDLEEIQAEGTAAIANAQVYVNGSQEPVIDPGTWTTAFDFQGDRVVIDSFSAPGIDANGTIGVDFNQSIPIGELALNVDLRSFELEPLNRFAPPTVQEYVQVAGLTSFDGRITGTLQDPRVAGSAQLNNLALNELLFEPLSGPVALSLSDGGSVDLQGPQDQIQLAVDEEAWPISFEVRNQEFVAKGYGEAGRRLHADILQLPLGALDIQPPAGSSLRASFGELRGLLNASLDADLKDFSNPIVEGEVTVIDPTINPIAAEKAFAAFRYANNTATLNQGELLLDDSQYLLNGSATLAPEIQYEGELTIPRGQIEDLVAIVESLDLSAFGPVDTTATGSAADLATTPVGLPETTFLNRLDSFVAFVENQPEDTDNTGSLVIPPLEDLDGEFTGAIKVAGSSLSPADLTADFDLQGNSWAWGTYTPPNQFVISGDVQQQTLSLDTFKIDAGETVVDATATASINRLEGRLVADNLPVELAELFYPLPVDVDGDLDVVTTFNGSLANPAVDGEVTIASAQVGEYPLDRVNADFSYRNAELALTGEAALEPTDEPITVSGNLLYGLPFMEVQPPVEQVRAIATVPSDSFDFINLLTEDRVRWESGAGEIVVQVDGSLQNPVVVGQASIREGLVSSTLLEDDLANINGNVQFDLTQVGIQQLQATMGDGQVSISGQLPLLASGQSILTGTNPQATGLPISNANGIAISLNDFPVDYEDKVEAVLMGQLLIAGAALTPVISGNIEIDDGQVQANRLLGEFGAIALPTEEEIEEVSPYRIEYLGLEASDLAEEKPAGFADDVVLQNLELAFGDRLNITGQPFYSITALGSLTVNGTLSDLRPEGTIELQSGLINLFSTRFRLDKNAPNTATFIPENGLDPILDVALKARVRNRQTTPAPPSVNGFATAETEISANVDTIGEVEFIRVEAIAQGPASDIIDNIVLTSNDSRSQNELLALLGRGAFSDVASGSLSQLTGFLGAGTLANIGNTIGDVVGLKSFSVFPTTDTSPGSSVGIGIGVEATAGIGNRFDISVLEILNNSTPPQLGIEYRFTDNLELRGSSNLDESDFSLEYNIDF